MLETPEGKKKLKSYVKDSSRDGVDSIGCVAGATSCVALILPTQIFVANAGDSRSVLF